MAVLIGALPKATMAQVYGGGGIVGGIEDAYQILGISTGSISGTVLALLFAVLSFMALAAVVVIVIAGISMVVGVGDDAAKDKAKKTIGYAIGGLLVIFFAGAIVQLVISETGSGDLFGNATGAVDIRVAVVDILKAVLRFMGLVAVVVIVIAGIMLVVSGGEDSAKDRAKKMILYAVIGLIVIALASAIVSFIGVSLSSSS